MFRELILRASQLSYLAIVLQSVRLELQIIQEEDLLLSRPIKRKSGEKKDILKPAIL